MAVNNPPPGNCENAALLNKLQTQLLAHGRKFLCGFSGGLDSSVLLHAAAKLSDIHLRAIHIHHGLHPDADHWTQHCIDFCRNLNVDLTVIKVDVDKTSGTGTEAAARHARYDAIARHIHEDEVLLTAHHMQDQAETVLLRLLRGSGSQGLAAMRAMTSAHGFRQFRPFLSVPKSMLQDYAESEKLKWIDDPSNEKIDFDRNYLRHEIMPLLEKRWPQASANFFRNAELLAEEHQCLLEQSEIFLSQIQGVDKFAVTVSALMQYSKAWRAQILRAWTQSLDTPPLPGNVLQEIEQSLLPARPDAIALVQWSGMEITRWRDCLYLSKVRTEMPADWECEWNGGNDLVLPNGDRWFFESVGSDLDIADAVRKNFSGPLLVRLRRGGERILLTNHEHHTSLKNRLQELGIPPWERRRTPVFSSGAGECLGMGDFIHSARFEDFCKAHGLRLVRKV